jgi:hypothetical protein
LDHPALPFGQSAMGGANTGEGLGVKFPRATRLCYVVFESPKSIDNISMLAKIKIIY